LSQRKGVRQNKPPVIKYSENPNSKAGQLVGYRADSRTSGQHTNLNCYTPLREELTKQLPLKDRNNKTKKHYPTTWQDYDRTSA
jgi:hypothetical protein